MTTREPAWTEQDRAEMLALAEYRTMLCPCGCGHLRADTTSNSETGPDFDATKTTCRARAALLEAQRAVNDGNQSNPDAAARIWQISMRKR